MNAGFQNDFVLPEDKLMHIHDSWKTLSSTIMPFAIAFIKVIHRYGSIHFLSLSFSVSWYQLIPIMNDAN
jgi:hypothetical protein